MGPFGSKSVTTTTALIDSDDGLMVVFEAPMGLYGRNEWRVVDSPDGKGLLLREENVLTGVTILMPFVLMTKKESHRELAARFVDKLRERP